MLRKPADCRITVALWWHSCFCLASKGFCLSVSRFLFYYKKIVNGLVRLRRSLCILFGDWYFLVGVVSMRLALWRSVKWASQTAVCFLWASPFQMFAVSKVPRLQLWKFAFKLAGVCVCMCACVCACACVSLCVCNSGGCWSFKEGKLIFGLNHKNCPFIYM